MTTFLKQPLINCLRSSFKTNNDPIVGKLGAILWVNDGATTDSDNSVTMTGGST